jgi:hypothetical protein
VNLYIICYIISKPRAIKPFLKQLIVFKADFEFMDLIVPTESGSDFLFFPYGVPPKSGKVVPSSGAAVMPCGSAAVKLLNGNTI